MFVRPGFDPNDNTLTKFRSLTVSNTGEVVSTVRANLYSWNITNRHTAVIYVKFYNKATAASAADTPVMTIAIQPASTTIIRGFDLPESFSTGISVRAVTESADSGTTSPGTLPIVELLTDKQKTGN